MTLEALRTTLNTRLTALEKALADPSHHPSLERLILDLARTATEEADTAARAAAVEAERQGEALAAKARKEGSAALEAEKAAVLSLGEQLREALATIDALKGDASAGQRDAGGLRAELEKAHSELEKARLELQKERTSAAATERQLTQTAKALAEEQAARKEDSAARAAEQKARAAAETGRAGERKQLEELQALAQSERTAAQARESELVKVQKTLERELQQSQAVLARERENGVQMKEAVARLERDLAGVRGEADARSKTLSHTQAEIEKALEEAQRTLAETTEELAAATGALTKARQAETDANARAEEALKAQRLLQEQLDASLSEVKTRSKTSSRSQTELEKSLKGTQRTLAETMDALAEAQEALKAADARWEVAEQQLAALREASAQASIASPPDAEALADTSDQPVYKGPARSARRVPMPEGIEVQIDGIPAKMVDLSLTGAQVLVPNAIKPNRATKLAILYGHEPITCKGKIMWARLEPGMREGKLWYRGGILFTSSDQAALQAFISSQEQ